MHTGKGQSLALVILAGIDIVLGMIAVGIAISAGWPGLETLSSGPSTQTSLIVGSLFLVVFIQSAFRLAMLIVMAWWTFRLVSNAHHHTRFPVSTRWAWLGWFVPIVSLWLPVQAMLNLNLTRGRLSGLRRLLILSWWVTRLLVSPMFAFISLIGVGVVAGLIRSPDGIAPLTIGWAVWMMITGLISQSLAVAVIVITQRHQPRPHEIVTAELF